MGNICFTLGPFFPSLFSAEVPLYNFTYTCNFQINGVTWATVFLITLYDFNFLNLVSRVVWISVSKKFLKLRQRVVDHKVFFYPCTQGIRTLMWSSNLGRYYYREIDDKNINIQVHSWKSMTRGRDSKKMTGGRTRGKRDLVGWRLMKFLCRCGVNAAKLVLTPSVRVKDFV